MARRVRLPPMDMDQWLAVSVPTGYDGRHLQLDIDAWVADEIKGDYYMRDSYVEDAMSSKLMRTYWFRDREDGMWFAMSWT